MPRFRNLRPCHVVIDKRLSISLSLVDEPSLINYFSSLSRVFAERALTESAFQMSELASQTITRPVILTMK